MLAVLKSGGICVTLSPTFSIQRKKDIAKATKFKVAIVQADIAATLEDLGSEMMPLSEVCIIYTPTMEAQPKRQPATAETTAFFVFTSGSSGEPKGVLKDHASVSTSAIAHRKAFGINEESRVLQFASHIWSISIYDFISTLIHGGCICIPSESDRMNNLEKSIQKLEVTHATLAPSTITDILTPAKVPSLKVLILGGEPVLRASIDTWGDKVHLYSNYGTSETLCAAATQLTKDHGGRIVGRHTTANRCWIVNPETMRSCYQSERLASLWSRDEP